MEKVCKECFIRKDLSEFYKHPQWVLWTLPRCKECIKKWRKTEREREMARKNDNRRYHNDDNRRKYQRERCSIGKRINRDKSQARQLASRSALLNPELIPVKCPITWWKVECLHHYDYRKPLSVIPCSIRWHFMFHREDKIEINPDWIVNLPDYRKHRKKSSLF